MKIFRYIYFFNLLWCMVQCILKALFPKDNHLYSPFSILLIFVIYHNKAISFLKYKQIIVFCYH